jgi:hypothetical protein
MPSASVRLAYPAHHGHTLRRLACRHMTVVEDRGAPLRRRWKDDVGHPMEQHATRETAMQAMQPRRASQIFVLHLDAKSSIFCLGCMATMMMMMVSNL